MPSRILALAVISFVLAAAPAQAGRVIVVDGNHAKRVNDPDVPPKSFVALPAVRGPVIASAARRPTKARDDRRAVYRALQRGLRSKRISKRSYQRWRAWYVRSIRTYRHLRGARREQLGYVIDSVEALALGNMLSPTRLPAAFTGGSSGLASPSPNCAGEGKNFAIPLAWKKLVGSSGRPRNTSSLR